MPYFFILPAFVVLELLLIAALVATFVSTPLRPYRAHVGQVLLWGTLGFVAANALVLLLTIGVVKLEQVAQAGESAVVKVLLVALLLPGPFVASATGFALGAFVGLRRATLRGATGGPTKS